MYVPENPDFPLAKKNNRTLCDKQRNHLIESFLCGNPKGKLISDTDSVYTSLPVGAALNLASLFDQPDTNNHNLPKIGAAERKRDVREYLFWRKRDV